MGGKELGRGTTATVRVARRRGTDAYCAAKIIPLALLTANVQANNQVRREISILTQMQHENVVRLSDVLYTQNNCYIMMELVTGGTLQDVLIQHVAENGGGLTEAKARFYFKQLVAGLQHVHGQQVAHRDLKPSNLLVDSTGVLKVSDFGLATIQSDATRLSTQCGTPHFVAPEVLSRSEYCGKRADVWSAGVVLYTMLATRVPFDDEALKYHQYDGLWRKIRRGIFHMPSHWSAEVQSLLRSVLEVRPERRPTADELAAHPWIVAGPQPHEGGGVQIPVSQLAAQVLPPPSPSVPSGDSVDAFGILPLMMGRDPLQVFVGLYSRPLEAAVSDVAAVLQGMGLSCRSEGTALQSHWGGGPSLTEHSPFVLHFIPLLWPNRTFIVASVAVPEHDGAAPRPAAGPNATLLYTVHVLRQALFEGGRETKTDGSSARSEAQDESRRCVAR